MNHTAIDEIVMHGALRIDSPQFGVMDPLSEEAHPQAYYDAIKARFAHERDVRLAYRPEGSKQYDTELKGELARYDIDPYGGPVTPRAPLTDTVECLFIGGGFSALLTAAKLRDIGVASIRIVERGADVGGTWYWNRYPGIACDVPSYDYLPLLDEMNYVPKRRYASGEEIFAHCQAIARRYNLYDLAVFQTTITETRWDRCEQLWHLKTDRGDHMKARFVICANGILSKPKLTRIKGMETFKGHSFHTSRWDYGYTGEPGEAEGQARRHHRHRRHRRAGGARSGRQRRELYVFQRTPRPSTFATTGKPIPSGPKSCRRAGRCSAAT
jgi:Predicted flavoprotein involved in K+ transport